MIVEESGCSQLMFLSKMLFESSVEYNVGVGASHCSYYRDLITDRYLRSNIGAEQVNITIHSGSGLIARFPRNVNNT
jgi:hypothetical protein